MTSRRATYLQVRGKDLRYLVSVNDIPVHVMTRYGLDIGEIPIHQFLLDGKNTLSVVVEPGGNIADPLQRPGPPIRPSCQFVARVAVFKEGESLFLNAGQQLAKCDYHYVASDVTPISFQESFDAQPAASWHWARAPKLNLETIRPRALAFLASVAELFTQGDGERIAELAAPALSDLAAAYPGRSLNAWKADLISTIPSAGSAKLADGALENAKLRLIGGGRMVEVLGHEGLPAIRTETDNIHDRFKDPNYAEVDLKIGLIGGNFRILI